MNTLAYNGFINLKNHNPLKVTLIYLLIGALWIAFSDEILLYMLPSVESRAGNNPLDLITTYQTYKGWLFIVLTSVLLFVLIRATYRKQAKYLEKIKNLEIHHAEILKKIPIGIYETDKYGNLSYLNEKAVKIIGNTYNLDKKYALSKTLFGKSRRIEKIWERAFKNRTAFYEEYKIRHSRKNTNNYVIDFAFPVYDINGSFSGYMGTLTDNTALRAAYHKVHEIESRLALAIRASNIGLWDWDVKTDKVYFSPEWKKQLGYEEHELSDDFSEWESRLHPEDKDKAISVVNEFMRNPTQGYQNQFRLRHKNGSYRWIYVSGEMQFDTDGEPLRLVGTHTDITLIKEGELARYTTEQRIHTLLEASTTVLYVLELDAQGLLQPTYVSENIETVLGFSRDEARHKDWWAKHLHPEDREVEENFFSELMRKGTRDSTYRFFDKNGELHWIRDFSRVVITTLEGVRKTEIIGLFTDITSEHESRETQKLLNTAFTNMYDSVLITNVEGTIISCNPSFEATCACHEESITGRHIQMFNADPNRKNFYPKLLQELESKDYWNGYTWGLTLDGRRIPFWLSVNKIVNGLGVTDKLMFFFKDMSDINAKEVELSRLAHYDELTGLPNRNQLDNYLDFAVRQSKRRGTKLALFFLDLDDFKNINDSLGYAAGDEVLKKVAELLGSLIQQNDTLARVGGDEFIIITESPNPAEESDTLAAHILKCLDDPIQLSGMQDVYINTSIGISIFPDDARDSQTLIQRANLTMNQAKNAGKHIHCFFDEEMEVKAHEQLTLLTGLRGAIRDEAFVIHYQPKVTTSDGSYTGAEALIRWENDDMGMIPPGKFIPLAESSGLITEIGRIVIMKAVQQIAQWIDQGRNPGVISINISVRQFRDPNLTGYFREALKRHQIPADNLAIEITESALMTDSERASNTVREFQAMGIKIYLDDFGTGFSSFAYLTRLMPDVIKIDMTFVKNINRSEKDNQIVVSMLDIAKNLGMKTIAEGVENEEHLTFLKTHQCDEFQGYLYSAPLAAGQFENLVFGENVTT